MDVNPTLSRRRALPLAGVAGLAVVLGARGEQASAASASATKVGLPYTVITEPTDAAVQAGLKAWRADFNGPFPLTRLLFGFSGTANLTTPLEAALGTTQMQAVRWEGLGKRSTVLGWARTDVPMFTAYGLLRNYRFEDFSLRSTAQREADGFSSAKGFLLRSNQAPKNNSDGAFVDVEWMGAWDYGLGLAGDSNANENSEVGFTRVALSNDASFRTAWLWSGMTPGNLQENQFLNYSFRDSKFEHSHGDVLRFDYGGSIHCDGFNSWIMTGQSAPGGIPKGTFVVLPRGNNFDSTMFMDLTGIRPEHRSNQVKLLDSAWSGAGNITLTGINSASYASRVAAFEAISLRGDASVLMQNCYLHGYVGLHGSAAPKMTLINVKSPSSQKLDWTKTSATTGATVSNAGVRTFDSASAANVNAM